jgi:hypothetical protein
MASALARRSSTKRASSAPPRRRSAAIRRVGASIASKARGAATGAIKRAKESQKAKAIGYGAAGAIAGAFIEAKVPQLPQVNGVPPQLLIGGVAVAAGFLLKGKIAEGAIYGGMGPLFAGVSTLARRFASGGTLAGEFSGGPYGFGPTSISVAGEYDDVV